MAMGKPIKAAKGGMMKKTTATKTATGGAKADRQGRALMAGKMAKNLPMIAPQSAYKKGGAAKKAFATGGVVDTGRPVAMPQGKKPPSKPVAISELSGTFKKGGKVEC